MQPKIYLVGMDGLHNNGKTTQLGLLHNYLNERGIPTLVRRGDGMRKGRGEELNDPLSAWWQENISRLRATGFEGDASMRAAEEAANRLNREILVARDYFMPQLLAKEGKEKGVILLDRGHISRLFVKRREDCEAGFIDIGSFEMSGGRTQEVLIPDINFLFHAPLEVLLERNEHRDTTPEKKEFNRTVLTRYYDDFETTMASLPGDLQRGLVRIDATKSVEEVHGIIIEHTMNLIEGGNTMIEFEQRGKERK
jgi:thymidylate kinase